MAEALTARDNAVRQMEALCASNRSKDSAIARLQQEKDELGERLAGAVSVNSASAAAKDTLGMEEKQQEAEDQCRKLEQENKDLKSKVESLMQQVEGPQSPTDGLMSPRDVLSVHTVSCSVTHASRSPLTYFSHRYRTKNSEARRSTSTALSFLTRQNL